MVIGDPSEVPLNIDGDKFGGVVDTIAKFPLKQFNGGGTGGS